MNSIPMVVLPVPAPPSTRMTLPRRSPPDRMSSSPAMPVLTRSRSGMLDASIRARRAYAGKAAVAPSAVLRLSLLQQRPQRVPSIRGRAHAPQGFQPFLDVIDFENVHPPRGALVERSLEQAGAEQQVERARNLREIIADVAGELLTAEHDARMPRKEQQQVEIAPVAQTGRVDEVQGRGVRGVHVLNAGAPFGRIRSDRSKNYSTP